MMPRSENVMNPSADVGGGQNFASTGLPEDHHTLFQRQINIIVWGGPRVQDDKISRFHLFFEILKC